MKPIIEQAQERAAAISTAGGMLTDEQAYKVPAIFMPWSETATYAQGARVMFNGLLYRCMQAHAAQANWTPTAAVSLWVRIDDPANEWPEWRQPTGAHDAYAAGAKVTYNGKHWINTHPANTHAPGVYGWEVQV